MNQKRSHKAGFILIPIVFLLIGYLLIFLLIEPFLSAYQSTVSLLFFNSDQQNSPRLSNIFTAPPKQKLAEVKLSDITFPQYGTRFGRLTISDASIRADLYFGDETDELKKGVGLYSGSFIPGYGRTILIAGHNHTYFHTLGNVKTGDTVLIETNYGQYTYQITKTQILPFDDPSAYDLNKNAENLILYTCYPFNDLGLTPKRFFVYADKLSGPTIDKQG